MLPKISKMLNERTRRSDPHLWMYCIHKQEQLGEEQRRRDTDNKAWEVKNRANMDEISRLR